MSSPLEARKDEVIDLINQGLDNCQIADKLGVSEASVRRFRKRHGLKAAPKPKADPKPPSAPEKPGAEIGEDEATLVSKHFQPTENLPSELELMKLHGLSPDEWEKSKAVASWWGDPASPSYQLKLWLKRKTPIEFIFPARVPLDYKPPKPKKIKQDKPVFGVVCGDSQVPFNDKGMEDCFLQFLAEMQPDELTDIGDQGDNPSVSSYAKNPAWHVDINTCIQATTDLNYRRRRACETMRYRILLGNHDIRLKNFTLNRAESLYGIKRGDLPEAQDDYQGSVLDWAYLTRADELNIEVLTVEEDEYFQADVPIVPGKHGLTAEHGNKTGKNAMLKTIERLEHSVCFGHTHTQGMETKTVWDIEGNHRTIYVANIGTQCQIKGGLGYTNRPDWVNGFLTYFKWADGRFTIEFAKYEDGNLFWRDKRWTTTGTS